MAKAASNQSRDPKYWEGVLGKLQEGQGAFLFPKAGRTQVRLLEPEDGPPFVELETAFRGQVRTKYMMLCVTRDEPEKVRGLVMSKSAFQGIANLLAEGYDLFDPEDGVGVTIVRTGSGLDTSYNVLPSRKPIPVEEATLEALADKDLDELVTQYAEMRSRRAEEDSEAPEDEEAPANTRRQRRRTERTLAPPEEEEEPEPPKAKAPTRRRRKATPAAESEEEADW